MPPKGKGVDVPYSGPDEELLFRTPRLEHLPQVLPLSDPRLSLALPQRGEGARVARLVF